MDKRIVSFIAILLLLGMGSGYVVQHVSHIEVSTNYKDMAGEVWIITLALNDIIPDTLHFSLTPEQFDTYTVGELKSKNTFSLDATNFETACEYPLEATLQEV